MRICLIIAGLVLLSGCAIHSRKWTELEEINGKVVEVQHVKTTGIGRTKFDEKTEQDCKPWVEIPKIPIKYEAE